MSELPIYKWWDNAAGGAVDVTAETLPNWIAYACAAGDGDLPFSFEVGRAIAECHGLSYWTQPWAAHAGTLVQQWTPEARTDPEWIRAWIAWYIGWVADVQARIKAETSMALGEDATTPGWRKPT